MPPAQAPDATALLSPESVAALDELSGVEVLAGVHSFNRAAHIGSLLDSVDASLAKLHPQARAAVLVADGGSQDGTAEVVRGWCEGKPRGPARRSLALAPPIKPGNALLGLLAAALRLRTAGIAVLDAQLAEIHADWIPALIEPVRGGAADFVAPAYSRAASEGTLTTNLLAPLTRALYGKRIQQLTGGCAAVAVPFIEQALPGWTETGASHATGMEVALTVAALASGARVVEVHLGRRPVDPGAAAPDLATTLVRTVGPVCVLMERYHDVWEQSRGSAVVSRVGDAPAVLTDAARPSAERMVRAFDLGMKDLLPVWEQVLSESTLDRLYPLALLDPEAFEFPPALWARVTSDFAVAYHERVLPPDHLLRALTPLYLGRVAAFLREAWVAGPAGLAGIVDRIGQAFEAEKDYLVARWR
jgi:hypothetical protein